MEQYVFLVRREARYTLLTSRLTAARLSSRQDAKHARSQYRLRCISYDFCCRFLRGFLAISELLGLVEGQE